MDTMSINIPATTTKLQVDVQAIRKYGYYTTWKGFVIYAVDTSLDGVLVYIPRMRVSDLQQIERPTHEPLEGNFM